MDNYETLRQEKVAQAKCVGDYYRDVVSYWYACNNDPDLLDTVKSFQLDSRRGKKLLALAAKQFGGKLEVNKDGFVKIICEYCNHTYTVNNIDIHQISCSKRP